MEFKKIIGYLIFSIGIPLAGYGIFMAIRNAISLDLTDGFNAGIIFANLVIIAFGGIPIYFGNNLARLSALKKGEPKRQ